MLPLRPILEALNRAEVRYVVVGGVAVVLRGYARLTADLDIVVDLAVEEARKAVKSLESIGLVPAVPVRAEEFADPHARRRWIQEKGMRVFSMVDPNDPFRHVDLFVDPPISFAELWSRSDVLDAGDLPVRTASVDDLIAMKRLAGRPRDLDDIDVLETLRDNERDERDG